MTSSASSARSSAGRCAWRCRASLRRPSGWRSPASSPPGCASCGGRRSPRGRRAAPLAVHAAQHKYYFDWFNEHVLAALTRLIGVGLWKGGDEGLIDGGVNGTAEAVSGFGGVLRPVQSGYLYSYAFWMVIGLAVLLGWFLRAPAHLKGARASDHQPARLLSTLSGCRSARACSCCCSASVASSPVLAGARGATGDAAAVGAAVDALQTSPPRRSSPRCCRGSRASTRRYAPGSTACCR